MKLHTLTLLGSALVLGLTSTAAMAVDDGLRHYGKGKHIYYEVKDDGFYQPIEKKHEQWDKYHNATPEQRKEINQKVKERRGIRRDRVQERRGKAQDYYQANKDSFTDEQVSNFKQRRSNVRAATRDVHQKRKTERRNYFNNKRQAR